MRTLAFTLSAFLASITALSAQTVVHTDSLNAPSYIIVVLSGVLLAFGFQFLLTALSVAVGVTAVGDLKKAYVENKYDRSDDDDDDDDDDMNMGVKITSAFGFWNLWTIGLSLFGATYLALKLIPISTDMTLITLALVIWATFFMLMFYLESRMAGTLLGGLINTAVSGLKASSTAVSSFFTPSAATEIQNVADNTINKIRDELRSEFDSDGIMTTLKGYVNKVDQKLPDYEKLRKDLKEIAEKSSGKQVSNNTAAKWTAISSLIQTALISDTSVPTEKAKQKAKNLKGLLAEVKNAYQRGDNPEESMKNALKASPIDEEKLNQYMEQIKQKIKKSTPENVEELQQEIEKIIDNPQASIDQVQAKLQEIDQETIVKLLTENTQLTKEQINDYSKKAQNALNLVSEKLGITNDDPFTLNLLEQFEGNVKSFINSTDAPELNYWLLKNDFKRAMNNPNESLNIVKRRLSTFDRDTMISMLTNTPWIDRKDIAKITDTIEGAKNEVSDQLVTVETKARSTMANLERRAVIQADHLRLTAVSAAWWLVTVIVISGATAVAGGLINIF